MLNKSEYCFSCGRPVTPDKVATLRMNPREARARFHEGVCLARFGAIHNYSNGQPDMVALIDRNRHLLLPGKSRRPQRYQHRPLQAVYAHEYQAEDPRRHEQPEYVDAEYYPADSDGLFDCSELEMHGQDGYGQPQRPAIGWQPLALPEPVEQVRFPQHDSIVYDPKSGDVVVVERKRR